MNRSPGTDKSEKKFWHFFSQIKSSVQFRKVSFFALIPKKIPGLNETAMTI